MFFVPVDWHFFNRFVATTVTPSVRRRPNPTTTAANFGIGAVFSSS